MEITVPVEDHEGSVSSKVTASYIGEGERSLQDINAFLTAVATAARFRWIVGDDGNRPDEERN